MRQFKSVSGYKSHLRSQTHKRGGGRVTKRRGGNIFDDIKSGVESAADTVAKPFKTATRQVNRAVKKGKAAVSLVQKGVKTGREVASLGKRVSADVQAYIKEIQRLIPKVKAVAEEARIVAGQGISPGEHLKKSSHPSEVARALLTSAAYHGERFDDDLEQELAKCARSGGALPIALAPVAIKLATGLLGGLATGLVGKAVGKVKDKFGFGVGDYDYYPDVGFFPPPYPGISSTHSFL
jgi:hypothetical protein